MNKFSKVVFFILALILVVSLISCVEWEPAHDCSNFFLSEDGQKVELTCPESCNSYKWYKSSDENANNPTEVGVEKTVDSDSFTEPGILYYRCDGFDKNGELIYSSPVIYVFYTGLPTVYLDTESGMEIDSKREYVKANLTIPGALSSASITVKGRGSSSWILMPKKSYTIKFDSKTKVLGMSKGKKWCLIANYIDKTKIGNLYASFLGLNVFNTPLDEEKDLWEPESEPVNLIVNGEYRGLYNITQAIKLDSKRIDISDVSKIDINNPDDDFNRDGKVSIEDGGFLVEFTSDTDGTSFCTLKGLTVTFKEPDLDDIEGSFSYGEIKEYVREKMNLLESSIFNETDKPFTEYINLDSMVNWFLVNEFMANNEASFRTSSFVYYDPSRDMFFMGPNWDFDRTLNNRDYDCISVIDTLNTWYNQLILNPLFTDAVKECWNSKKGALKESFDKAINLSKKIAIAATVDSYRWDTHFTSYSDVETWLNKRFEFMDGYINNL